MTTTNDRTLCCSDTCEKRFECDRSHINHIGTYYVEDYSSFGTGTYTDNGCEIEHWCGKLGEYKMFEPIKKTSDYQQWKDWLDKWNVKYEEKTWNPNEKELVVGGSYCQASVAFDLEDNFICMTAYE